MTGRTGGPSWAAIGHVAREARAHDLAIVAAEGTTPDRATADRELRALHTQRAAYRDMHIGDWPASQLAAWSEDITAMEWRATWLIGANAAGDTCRHRAGSTAAVLYALDCAYEAGVA